MPVVILLTWVILFFFYWIIIKGLTYIKGRYYPNLFNEWKYLSLPQLLFLSVEIIYALILAYEANSSDETSIILATMFIFPLAVLLGGRSVRNLRRQSHDMLRKLSLVFIMIFVPFFAYYGMWFFQNPLYFGGLRYKFEYGHSPSWQAVQFSLFRDGEYVEGPWVGAYPLRVSFPDINGDKYRDIRIDGYAGVVEYQFLPERGAHGQYWTLIKNTGYKISYPADGYAYP